MNFIIIIFFMFPIFSWASNIDDEIYFKFHQAVGLHELYNNKRCPNGDDMALRLIKSLNPTNKELKEKLLEFKAILEGKKSQSQYDSEIYRLSIHLIQEKLGLKHQSSWHEQVISECKSSFP